MKILLGHEFDVMFFYGKLSLEDMCSVIRYIHRHRLGPIVQPIHCDCNHIDVRSIVIDILLPIVIL